MTPFQLPTNIADLPHQLRVAEPQAPKQIKHLLITSAEYLEHANNVIHDCVAALDEASTLRAGQMDSESRAQDIQRQVQMLIKSTADRLRCLKFSDPPAEAAVI